jgi:hypothetical protein
MLRALAAFPTDFEALGESLIDQKALDRTLAKTGKAPSPLLSYDLSLIVIQAGRKRNEKQQTMHPIFRRNQHRLGVFHFFWGSS